MRKYHYVIFTAVLFIWGCSNSMQDARESISPRVMEEYISYLASDRFKGRNTPSPELDSAGAYIAGKFESFGLQKVNGSYFQRIPLGFVSLGSENSMTISQYGTKVSLRLKDDFVPFEITGNSTAEGEAVFCGYGIVAPEYNYDDYEGVVVKGKIVVLLKHEPGENDSTSVFKGTKSTKYSDLDYKVKTAVDKGAAGVVILTDPLNHTLLKPVGFPWPSLSKIIPKDALPLMMLNNEYNNIPVVHAGEEFIKHIFGSVEVLKAMQEVIDKDVKGHPADFETARITIKTSVDIRETPAHNVCGMLEGSDPELKKEVLVIGAHYDHSGISKVRSADGDSILNGADDNASGTSGVIAVARAFSMLGEKPKRSILFLAFAGEERGLFGSRYYVDNPLIPLANTVAMLNMDMIGRNSPDSVYINAHSRSPELKAINEEANRETGLSLIYNDNEGVGGSDHAPFLKKGIASLFYFAGMHDDYHKVTDEAERIDFTKASRIAQLVFGTAFRISNDNKKYKVTGSSTSLIF